MTTEVPVAERRSGRDRRIHPMARGPWYKHVDTRVSVILLAVWLSVMLMGAIAIGVRSDLRINYHIEERQLHNRDRTCLIINEMKLPDPNGLCSPAVIAKENER